MVKQASKQHVKTLASLILRIQTNKQNKTTLTLAALVTCFILLANGFISPDSYPPRVNNNNNIILCRQAGKQNTLIPPPRRN